MIRRPPRSTRLSHSFPTRRSSELLAAARRPLVIVGGGGWDAATSDALRRFAEANALPVGASFRCQDYFDNRHPNYAGHVGIGIDPKLAARVRDSDLLIVVGARLGEMTTSGYPLLDIPRPRQGPVHVPAGSDEPRRVSRADSSDERRAGKECVRTGRSRW